MKDIKFIHCADLHLDSPFVGLQNLPQSIYKRIQQSVFISFEKIIDAAIDKQVDFIIIAGDIYDGEDRSIRAQIFFRSQMERLKEKGISAFVVHGNHDHLGGSWTNLHMPENVHIFKKYPEMIPFQTANGNLIHLYGFSYPKKHVTERVIDKYERVEGAHYHIGILHGHDSQNSAHYSYAPFKIEDLIKKEFDYWALGHIHKQSILHEEPFIIYPGNIQGRHKKESGSKGCYFVKMDGIKTNAEFIQTAPIEWKTIKLESSSKIQSFDDLYQLCVNTKEDERIQGMQILIEFVIESNLVEPDLHAWFDSDEFLQLLQEGEESMGDFVWPYSLKMIDIETNTSNSFSSSFFAELNDILDEIKDLKEPLSPLYDHPKAKRYLEQLTPAANEEIQKEAGKLLNKYLQL